MNPYRDLISQSRPNSGHPHMSLRERAKIFSSFAALRGHEEAILEEERTLVSRAILSDYAQEQVGRKLGQVRKQALITITYFRPEQVVNDCALGTYVTETDVVTGIDPVGAELRLGSRRIPFADIADLQWA